MERLKAEMQRGVQLLDKNGDGDLSIDEVQEAGRHAWKRVQAAYVPVQDFLSRYRWTAQLATGYLGAFYGGNFTHVFLCANSFDSSEGAAVIENAKELLRISQESGSKFMEKVGKDGVLLSSGKGEPSNENSIVSALYKSAADTVKSEEPESSPSDTPRFSVPTNTILAFVQCIDPGRLLTCVRSLYSGFLVALCAALNDNAAKFGLGITMGTRISTFLLSLADRFIVTAEQKLKEKLAADPAEADAKFEKLTDQEKENALAKISPGLAWAKLGLKTVCTSLGVFLSWRLKDAAAVWSVCHWGGVKCAKALFNLVGHDDLALQEMVGVAIGWYGFAFHLRHLNRPAIPAGLNVAFLPMTLAENILKGLAFQASGAPPAA